MSQPAFPTFMGMGDMQVQGMTLRDYFAAKASDEDIADAMSRIPKVERIVNNTEGRKVVVLGLPDDARQIARYMCADAMLKARKQ